MSRFGGNILTQEAARQYGMSFEEAEAAKRSGSLPDDYEQELVRPFMDTLALEISRALQFFLLRPNSIRLTILFWQAGVLFCLGWLKL